MAHRIWNSEQLTGLTQPLTVKVDTAGHPTLIIYNFTPYTLVLHTGRSYSTVGFYEDLIELIEPWRIQPIGAADCQPKSYLTVDPNLPQIPASNTYLSGMQSVALHTSQYPASSVSARSMLGLSSSEANITNTSLDTSSTVTNDVSNPVNTQAVIGSPVSNGFIAIYPDTMSETIISGGVMQKVVFMAGNQGDGALPSPCQVSFYNGTGSSQDMIASYDVSGMPACSEPSMLGEINLSPGITNNGIYAYSGNSPASMTLCSGSGTESPLYVGVFAVL